MALLLSRLSRVSLGRTMPTDTSLVGAQTDVNAKPGSRKAAKSSETDPAVPKRRRGSPLSRFGLALLLLGQLACAMFFVYDLFGGQLGLRSAPISWMAREIIQIAALSGLVVGALVTAFALRRSEARRAAVELELEELSEAFHDLMQKRFTEWGLTPAEKDVALFIIKGFSIQEISGLRETSDGTVKAQMAAIYRKAGVSSRAQLVTLFIDHLIEPFA